MNTMLTTKTSDRNEYVSRKTVQFFNEIASDINELRDIFTVDVGAMYLEEFALAVIQEWLRKDADVWEEVRVRIKGALTRIRAEANYRARCAADELEDAGTAPWVQP